MDEIERKARELLKAECPDLRDKAFEYGSMMTVINLHVVMRALRAALTPPEGYVLVPVEPTKEMLVAGDAYQYVGNTYAAMLAARPEVSP